MAVVRQLAGLYLRGSLANVTMRQLSKEQQEVIADLVNAIASNPRLDPIRRSAAILSRTIKGDYLDPDAVEQEFLIAIWKGVVNLLYHRDYKFVCKNCERSTTRELIPCPHCKCALRPDGTITTEVTDDCISTIQTIPGPPKYEKPYELLEDEEQLVKFFSTYIIKYVNQQLRENQRKPIDIIGMIRGTLTEVLIKIITYGASRRQIRYEVAGRVIKFRKPLLETSPEFSFDILLATNLARSHGHKLVISDNNITVPHSRSYAEVETTIPHYVNVMNDDTPDDGVSIIGSTIDDNNDIDDFIRGDTVDYIRTVLPDGDCQKIYNIYMGWGSDYDDYRKTYDESPTKSSLSSHLGISENMVSKHLNTIAMHVLAVS